MDDELYTARLNANELITQHRINATHAGVLTPAGRVDSDETSIRNLLGVYQAAALSLTLQQPFDVEWRMSDNSVVNLDALGVVTMGNAVLQHVQACYKRSWVLKGEVEAAATAEEIEAIDFAGGWPG